MSENENTSMTLRLPVKLRERLKKAAAAEERTESQFVRYHLQKAIGAKFTRKAS